MSWAFEDELDDYAKTVLRRLADSARLAPSIWPLEVANAVLMGERRNRIKGAAVLEFALLLRGLRVEIDYSGVDQALDGILSLARIHSLSAYDAAYLELAIRRGAELATKDKSLRRAAEKSGVSIAGRLR
jgi:predicted nucleic acid-binding protein